MKLHVEYIVTRGRYDVEPLRRLTRGVDNLDESEIHRSET